MGLGTQPRVTIRGRNERGLVAETDEQKQKRLRLQ